MCDMSRIALLGRVISDHNFVKGLLNVYIIKIFHYSPYRLQKMEPSQHLCCAAAAVWEVLRGSILITSLDWW